MTIARPTGPGCRRYGHERPERACYADDRRCCAVRRFGAGLVLEALRCRLGAGQYAAPSEPVLLELVCDRRSRGYGWPTVGLLSACARLLGAS